MEKNLKYNTLTSLVYSVVTVICGLILPRLILGSFGSEVNGLIDSITQFLAAITFLELGIGAVVRSALYKPLAENNNYEVSCVLTSARRFLMRIFKILAVYVVFLAIFYPFISHSNFDYIYILTMVLILSVGSFAQYYFGIINALLLSADQKGYIQYLTQIVAVIVNAVVTIVLIFCGCGIHVVKMAAALINFIQPFFLYLYVKKNYSINFNAKYEKEPISQKWNGIAQHVAAIVLTGTDSIVLTVFSTLSNVSIYSIYYKVVFGITQLINAMTAGIQAVFGDLWARKEKEQLLNYYKTTEWLLHTVITFFFGLTSLLIVPFVNVYTYGINDANYNQPIFGIVLVLANALVCYRLPYNLMILAAGHYKQTQNGFIISACVNVILSILTVNYFGIIGVAVGTFVAVAFQTIYMAIYTSKNLVSWPILLTAKQFAVDILTIGIILLLNRVFKLESFTYASWILLAIKSAAVSVVIMVVVNLLLYKNEVLWLIKKFKK